ncbi:MAG TPA: hypothetical protein PLT33_11870 [Deltaproteobacteria bacterium]|nr:hypothetical protein [Deltaproteobacteria bacterium]HQO61556.1 hypothetical protein [Deltaproteobacteria bacterium]
MKKPAIHEHEFISKVLMGNEDAIRFANELFFVSQIWDDMIDKDPAPSEENINRMMWVVLIELPLNPFYHANFAHLIPCMKSAIRDWLDANDFEKEARENPHDACGMELRTAYIIRDTIGTILSEMAYIIGGYDWMRQVSPEVRKWVHDEDYDDYVKGICRREKQ